MLYLDNAFLHAENDKCVLMLLCGKLAELFVKEDPKLYINCLITSKQVSNMLYVKLTNAIYGMLRNEMLFYKKLRIYLEKIGLK